MRVAAQLVAHGLEQGLKIMHAGWPPFNTNLDDRLGAEVLNTATRMFVPSVTLDCLPLHCCRRIDFLLCGNFHAGVAALWNVGCTGTRMEPAPTRTRPFESLYACKTRTKTREAYEWLVGHDGCRCHSCS